MRSALPPDDGPVLGGHRQEDLFWGQTLRNVAAACGVTEPDVETALVCADKKRQWRLWTNLWHSAAIRSMIYTVNAPFRTLAQSWRRPRA